ncbi:PDZ domain-containing protein [Streptomyces sp. NPDC026665]|uniref:PDZ domain-containing protein n=1 Tax=Streptomyces sp. NPDC026665 TaxID=3154798 RepID=UPI00341142A1
MEQTALRPKPMPGRDPGGGTRSPAGPRPSGGAGRPRAARRGGRRLAVVLAGVSAGVVLLLSGVGLGAVGATMAGMGRPADLQRRTGPAGQPQESAAADAPGPGASGAPRPGGSGVPGESGRQSVRGTLGVEAVDAPGGGALIVGVHLPGPGYTAGLVRGDVLLAVDRTGITSAADLARAVADARPGGEVTLRVRHASGGYEYLSTVPGTAV